jgi:hypothetical protein
VPLDGREFRDRTTRQCQSAISSPRHQRLAYADDVNLLGDNIDTIKKNTKTLIDARKEAGLEINVEKTKYMLLSRHQNAGQNCALK